MIIYYTHNYSNGDGESHRLLERAIAEYLSGRECNADDPCRQADISDGICTEACGSNTCSVFSGVSLTPLIEDRTISYDETGKARGLVTSMRTTGEFGKPFIPGFAPFSISHSGNTWAVLITGYSCGLDIQYGRNVNHLSVANRFFAEEDAAIIRETADRDVTGMSAADQERALNDMFFRLWARREALIKAIGGSVASTDIPAVSGDTAEYRGATYRIMDVEIPAERHECPGRSGSDIEMSGHLYAAVCFTAIAVDTKLPRNEQAPVSDMLK